MIGKMSLFNKESFLKRISGHEMKVLVWNGVYRHIEFKNPGTSIDRFEIVTWPNHLCISRDCGTYVFSRLEDMFEFFRGENINPDYWKQKVVAQDQEGVTQYSKQKFIDAVWSDYTDFMESNKYYTTHDRKAVYDDIEALVIPECDDEVSAFRAVDGFNCRRFQFTDFYEHDVREFTARFLWNCHAIVWGIQMFDAYEKTGRPEIVDLTLIHCKHMGDWLRLKGTNAEGTSVEWRSVVEGIRDVRPVSGFRRVGMFIEHRPNGRFFRFYSPRNWNGTDYHDIPASKVEELVRNIEAVLDSFKDERRE